VARYDPGRGAAGRRPSFRAFLWRVVRDRLGKWARGQQRREGRVDRSVSGADAADAARGRPPAGPALYLDPWQTDPPGVLESWERAARLEAVLGNLDPVDRALWDGLVAGRPLRRLAAEQRLSYDQTKRRQRRLVDRLRAAVA
jgi:DNA-directed RNA polymerase specialized sigma24 family protein